MLTPDLEAWRNRLSHFERLPEARLPADFTAVLRPYQQEGVRWLSWLKQEGLGGLLADDMGLGKTLQAMALLDGRALVVAPTSVLPNWQAELARFRPQLKVTVYHGPERRLPPPGDGIILTSYALLRIDQEALAKQQWDVVVLDEAQTIKNPDSKVARAALSIPAQFRLCLSGTPVENRLTDLWSQMRFLNPGLLGERDSFVESYERPIATGDTSAAARLTARLKPFVLRRLKRDVVRDLPPRDDVVLRIELSEGERALYDALLASARADVLEKLSEGSVMAALEALLRLRQACCHSALVPGAPERLGSTKLEVLVEKLEQASSCGHRSLVFSQWTSLLDLLEPMLTCAGLRYLRLDGSTADRGSVVSAFQADGGPDVLIMSLKAGGVGLNLTAADHVFLVDPWWNPAAEDQAADRAHRIGQTRPVTVHRLVAADTVEERILALQAKKRALADSATTGAAAASLTRADLETLLA